MLTAKAEEAFAWAEQAQDRSASGATEHSDPFLKACAAAAFKNGARPNGLLIRVTPCKKRSGYLDVFGSCFLEKDPIDGQIRARK